MPELLHQTDEETDAGAYGAYLRAQSSADLLDIAQHLNPETYPARLDAARREMQRRRLLNTPLCTEAEYLVRRLAVAALLLAGTTLALAFFLTPAVAEGPAWPNLDTLRADTPSNVVIGIYCVAVLRAVVFWSARLGFYCWILGGLAYWVCSQALALRHRQVRSDVWRLALLAFCVLSASLAFALSPLSAIPTIFQPHDDPVVTLRPDESFTHL